MVSLDTYFFGTLLKSLSQKRNCIVDLISRWYIDNGTLLTRLSRFHQRLHQRLQGGCQRHTAILLVHRNNKIASIERKFHDFGLTKMQGGANVCLHTRHRCCCQCHDRNVTELGRCLSPQDLPNLSKVCAKIVSPKIIYPQKK